MDLREAFFGQVISETLWMGSPVVAFDDGMGVAYQVHDGKNGRLIEPGNFEAFGAAVIDLMDHPTKLKQFSETAKEMQRQLVHPEIVFQAYENAYLSAIDHIKRRPVATVSDRSLSMKWGLFKEHLFPWFWKHSVLIGSGMISSGYTPKSDIEFDALPDEAPALNQNQKTRPFLRLVDMRRAKNGPGASGPADRSNAERSRVSRLG